MHSRSATRSALRVAFAGAMLGGPGVAFGQTTDAGAGGITYADPAGGTTANAGPDGASARRDADCSPEDGSARCRETSAVSADSGGLAFGHSRTSVERVLAPGKGFAQLYGEAGFLYGTGDTLTMVGGQGALGLQGAFGGTLPGPEGGGWSGLGYRLNGGGGFLSIEIDTGSGAFATSSSTESASYSASGVLGYQFLSHGRLDPSTLQQSGFGLFLGFSGGVFGTGETDPSPSYGPSFVLSFPKYNAGTARLSSFFVSGLVLPLEDFLIATVNVGFAVGLGGGGDGRSMAAPGSAGPARAPSSLPPPELPPVDF